MFVIIVPSLPVTNSVCVFVLTNKKLNPTTITTTGEEDEEESRASTKLGVKIRLLAPTASLCL